MATVAAPRRAFTARRPSDAFVALARRTFMDARSRTLAFAYAYAIYAYIQPAGFRSTYPTLADRIAFAHSFAGNAAIRVFYGYPYDPITIGGYTAWRVGGTLAIVAAVFGVLAAVRPLRDSEESGRTELVLASPVGRSTAFGSTMAGIAGSVLVLWVASTIGYVLAGLPVGGSAYLSLATASVTAVFVGVGALASQLAPTRRTALELGGAVVAVSLLLRVIADTLSGAGWVRWTTPLGWAEEMRPFTGPHAVVLLLPILMTLALLTVAARIGATRDVGTGLLPTRDTAPARLGLLSSVTAQALRTERGSLMIWGGSVVAFALVLGMIAPSISSAGISSGVSKEIAKLGSGSIFTPTGYIAFVFVFFILAMCLFMCSQVAAARHEEAGGQLETLIALPVGRLQWLGGRLLLAAGGATGLSLIAGVATWAGAGSQGVRVSPWQMLEAAANCLPTAALFLGFAVLAYAIFPRASSGISYGLVTVAFLWYLVGAVTGAPQWLVDATPFAHIGFVPTQPFRAQAAIVMIAIGAFATVAALVVFRRRDLTEA
jgi:polyether ionophore transport system permease protein